MDENTYRPVLPPPVGGGVPEPKDKNDNTLGIVCHLLGLAGFIFPFGSVIGPLVLWLVKRAESPYLDSVGKEVLNFNISFAIYALIAFATVFIFIGFLLLPAVGITWIVLTIMGAVKASEGKFHAYPLTIRLIK